MTAARLGPAVLLAAARHAPLILFALLAAYFGYRSPQFLSTTTLGNILVHSSAVAVVAAGMTVVLVTGGIDLSVGSIMFLAAAVAVKLSRPEGPLPAWAAALAIPLLGALFGAANAAFITGLRVLPFIVTLATLFIGRGLALQLTNTEKLDPPPGFLDVVQSRVLGVPFSVLLMAAAIGLAHLTMSLTPFGRQAYALGNNPDAARRAGIPVGPVLFAAYVISGLCASLGGAIAVAQAGTVSPELGERREFDAIAAAVLGGTSLFGGRGSVFPGTLLGALFVRTIATGLDMSGASEYSYPVVTGAVIFLAVLADRLRSWGGGTPIQHS